MAVAPIYIVSGGNGASGELLVRTALAQFDDVEPPIVVVPYVRRKEKLDEVVSKAAEAAGLIVHTMIDPRLRDHLVARAAGAGLATIDTVGPLLEQLGARLGRKPLGQPGRYRRLREDYFRRIESIEFAVAHDDGINDHELHLADVVLVGVSRTGKTPLCMYMAMLGWKAANVPIIKGVPPPAVLFKLDPSRVIGLTLKPEQLLAHRRYREQQLGVTGGLDYADPNEIYEELDYARDVFRRGRFATVDITNKPLEESAKDILALVEQ